MALTDIPIIDTDSHVMEPPDLWTSRMSRKKWGDRIPHLVLDERRDEMRWLIGGKRLTGVANWATAGWHEPPPSHPRTLEEAEPGAWNPEARLARMDDFGIWAQALYPNLLTFSGHAFRAMGDDELIMESIRAYNDFLTDFASVDPKRFVLLSVLPYWDVEASIAELLRCRDKGHHGVCFLSKPYKIGLPPLHDPHWEPLFSVAQETGMSLNFHVGFQEFGEDDFKSMLSTKAARSDYAKLSAMSYLGNAETVADLTLFGVCHKYPELNFMLVESGFGWLPYYVEALDWQWHNSGASKAYPEMELPSFYFRRQVYGSFWFEKDTVNRMIDLYADNITFESDYPHPTSLSPGPASSAKTPRETILESLDGIPTDVCRKVLHDNAARLYHLSDD